MPRPVWFEKAPDVAAVAEHLDAAAKAAVAQPGPLAFEPRPLPAGTDPKVLHQAALLRARRLLAASHAEKDRILAQEVNAIDDLVRSANLLVERLREWYALHAPEATRQVTDAKELATLVSEQGDRAAVMAALHTASVAETSLGSELDPADLAVLRGFASALAGLHSSWAALESRVSGLMQEVAPNVASVVGPTIGARLIALSGGLTRLATWPAGTVQLLGAETALFRHLKEGTRPPKHGILFQHPLVHQAPPWQRGATARALALAAATAAKADAFTKRDLTAHLKAQVDADLARVRERKAPAARADGWQRGPARGGFSRPGGARGPPSGGPGPRRFDGPRRDGPPSGFGRGPPRDGPRDGSRGPPSAGGGYGRGPPSGGPRRFDGGPPREGFGRGPSNPSGPGGPGAGYAGPRGPPSGGFGGKPRRKPQGAFRSDNKPAKPPGRGEP